QEGDPPILGVARSPGARLEGSSGVLEELLLPAVEHRGVDAVLVTEVRDRGLFEEMEPKNGDLLLGREALSGLLGHGSTSARSCSLFEQTVCPISTEAKHLDDLTTQGIHTKSGRGRCRRSGRSLAAECVSECGGALQDIHRHG